MNTNSIKTFLAVMEHKSISAAAKNMFVSESAVSSQISRLENELGVKLFERKKGARSAALTEAGAAFVPLAYQWNQANERIEIFKTDQKRYGDNNVLRIGSSISGYEYIGSEISRLLTKKIPNLKMQISIVERPYALKFVLSHQVDVMLVFGAAGNVPKHPSVRSIPLLTEDRYILCPADTPLPDRIINPWELDPHFEINFTGNTIDLIAWHNRFFPNNTTPYAEVDHIMMCYYFLRDPRCWTICPASIALGLIQSHPNRLTYRQVDPMMPPRTGDLLIAENYNQEMIISALIGCADEYVETIPTLHRVEHIPG